MAKETKKKTRPRGVAWTRAMHAELRKHSKAKTPIATISKQMKRTIGALRQQALKLGWVSASDTGARAAVLPARSRSLKPSHWRAEGC
jgi:hypothetical protein